MKKMLQLVLWTFLFSLFALTNVTAQDQLADMVGIWDHEISDGSLTFHNFYQVTTGPSSLTLRYQSSKIEGQTTPGITTSVDEKLYQLTVADRNLSGTVTVDNSDLKVMGCSFEQRTFPVQGRISPDWNSISIVENHDSPSFNPCGWNFHTDGERVRVFKRAR